MLSDKQVYQWHRWLGLIGGAFLLVISLTGIILVFEDEIHRLTGRDRVLKEIADGPRQSVDSLLAGLRAQYPDAQVTGLRLYTNQPDMAIRADIRRGEANELAYLDPYTGNVLDVTPNQDVFFRTALELHKGLLLGFPGEMIMGLVGLCLLGSTLTGLWYYRQSLLQPFKTGVRWGKSARIVNGDLHKLLGVSALLFLLLMGGTGVFFHWEELEHAFDEGEAQKPEKPVSPPPPINSVSLLVLVAQNTVPELTPEIISFPKAAGDPLVVRGNRPESRRILGKFNTSVEVDPLAGQVTQVFHAEEADAEYQFEHLAEQLHFGRFGGWLTKGLWTLGALSLATLVLTGLVVWRKRR